jgi:hypothetical protein
MNTCETCKHWDEADYPHHGVRECKNVPMLWESFEWTKDADGRRLKPKLADRKAFAQDASDYHASLYTMKDFGCNQWKQKS